VCVSVCGGGKWFRNHHKIRIIRVPCTGLVFSSYSKTEKVNRQRQRRTKIVESFVFQNTGASLA